ncbi:MAG: hypothetical protein QGF00_18050 [Planctomycetota bacterium]|jgi:hypothetical protein|nr:hypothetical protein [Planctomycetota bacterium]MDP7251516.1 hypothetical protein [Planctomycetota bacterium]
MKTLVLAILLFQSTNAEDARKSQGWWFSDETSQFVFFAVLEGLYRDGLSTETVELIIPRRDRGTRPSMENFIYTCPLCHPSYEAFVIYLCRKPFYGQKGSSVETFGKGLPEATISALKSADGKTRRGMIRQLISKWVQIKLESMNLTDKGLREWQEKIKKLHGQGTAVLKRFKANSNGEYYKNLYKDWEECPVCAGSLEACKMPVSGPRIR